jgi:hypothetical protein
MLHGGHETMTIRQGRETRVVTRDQLRRMVRDEERESQ